MKVSNLMKFGTDWMYISGITPYRGLKYVKGTFLKNGLKEVKQNSPVHINEKKCNCSAEIEAEASSH